MGDQHNTTTHKNCAMTHIQVMLRFKVGVDTQVRAQFESWQVGCPCHVSISPFVDREP